LQSEQLCCGKSRGEEVLPGMPMGSRRLGDISLLVVRTPANCTEAPEGVIDSNSALQIFDCDGLLCGRVAWLRNFRDRAGQIQRDRYKPDHVLRQRFVCGLTVIWRLHPTDSGNWNDGWFYNPDDGKTYRTAAELRFDDMLGAVAWRKPQIVRPRLSSPALAFATMPWKYPPASSGNAQPAWPRRRPARLSRFLTGSKNCSQTVNAGYSVTFGIMPVAILWSADRGIFAWARSDATLLFLVHRRHGWSDRGSARLPHLSGEGACLQYVARCGI
jgi:hypothetical protein